VSLAENVKWRRRALGITQAELARRIRVNRQIPDRSYVCRIESGDADPRLSTVRSLAIALGLKPWMLVAEIYEAPEFWNDYVHLTAAQKRDVQRHIQWLKEGRG
jgi:transcriptional regulator with XRE-family HTH domain